MTWKKGQSGNPAGRPKMTDSFSDTARELVNAKKINIKWEINGKVKELKLKSNKALKHGLISASILEGLKGNYKAVEMLINRIDGKPDQKLMHEGGISFTGKTDEELRELIKQLDESS